MINKLKPKRNCLAILVLTLFISCDKELSGLGNYAIGINNSSTKEYKLAVFLDGELKNNLTIKSEQQASYMGDCSKLFEEEHLNNVVILKDIPEGTHHIELKDKDSQSMIVVDVMIRSDACVTQRVEIDWE